MPPRAGPARGPDRGGARRPGRRRRAHRRGVDQGGARCVSSRRLGAGLRSAGPGQPRLRGARGDRRRLPPRLHHATSGHLPTSFDYLSLLNTTLPLVFVAIGQSLVVLTGGIDLSVGGIVSLCVAVTATTVDGSRRWRRTAGSWSCSPWAPPCGAVNGLIVAQGADRADPHHAGHAVHLHRPRAVGAAGAGRVDSRPSVRLVLTNPNVPTGLIWLASGHRRLAGAAADPVRDAGVRGRQRRGQRASPSACRRPG